MSDTNLLRRSMLANTLLIGGGVLGAASLANATVLDPVSVVATFSALASTTATVGQIVEILCHTSGNIGGGTFKAISQTHATTDGGMNINSATTGIRWTRVNYSVVDVQMFGARGNYPTDNIDDTAAINAAIAYFAGAGGTLKIPKGQYKTTSTILLTKGIRLIGDGHNSATDQLRQGTSSIYAVHSGAAILSLKGAIGCTVQDISLEAGQAAYPKVGLLLGRSSGDSAGYHKISRVSVYGYHSVAAYYSIASEDNLWEDIISHGYGGVALYGFVTSTHDIFAVDGCVTSSNLDNTVIRPFFITTANSDSSACIFMECSQAMGSWTFIGGYLTLYRGSYVHINSGEIQELITDENGQHMGPLSALGPFTFIGTSGEILDYNANHPGDRDYTLSPMYGFNLTAYSPVKLPGLTITGARMQLVNKDGIRKTITQQSNLTLVNPNIVIPPLEDPTTGFILHREKIIGGVVDVGLSSGWINATLNSGWVNVYGSPYAAASYSIDGLGRISCRGTVQGGSGVIFTLPVGYRPLVSLFIPTFAAGAMGRLLIATNGNVSLYFGGNSEVDLSTIQFKPN